MILSIDIQIYYFLSTVAAGMIIGIMFDIYRIVRGFNYLNRFITAVSDFLFWILAAVITFIFFLYTNNGDLRYYTFVGLILGLFIYFKLISRFFMNSLRLVIYYVLKFFRIIIILLFFPIKLIRYFFRYAAYKSREAVKLSINSSKAAIKKLNKNIKGKKEKKT